MRMIFTKLDGKFDRLEIIRADGSVEKIDCPKQRIIPHEMVHFAVERTLGLDGFLTTVAAGGPVDFATLETLEAEAVERLVETMQADAWSAPSGADELIQLYRLTCEARGHDAVAVDTDSIEAIRDEITRLQIAWDEVAVGASIELRF